MGKGSPESLRLFYGLDEPTFMREGNTDFDAENSRLRTVDASHCGTYLQVIDLKTCLTSEVVQVP